MRCDRPEANPDHCEGHHSDEVAAIATNYELCAQTAFSIPLRAAHCASRKTQTHPSTRSQVVNKPLSQNERAAARPLAGRVSLITGSTGGIVLPVVGGWTAH
jgi:hypothetical protein